MRGPDRFLLPRARDLRRRSTLAEARLWEQLRGRRLGGFKFARQSPAGSYIADFLCRERRLIVEVDGATHSTDEELEADRERTRFLGDHGFRVIRFSNDSVLDGMDGVLAVLLKALHSPK